MYPSPEVLVNSAVTHHTCAAVTFVQKPDFSGPANGFGGKKDGAIVEGSVANRLKTGQAPPVDLSYYADSGAMGGHMVALLA